MINSRAGDLDNSSAETELRSQDLRVDRILITDVGHPPSRPFPGLAVPRIPIPVAALVAFGATWCWLDVPRTGRTTETILAEYVFAAGVSLLIIALLGKFNAILSSLRLNRWVLDVPVAVVLFVLIWMLGMRHFGGYDHSEAVQAAWLQLRNLIPFRDFPLTLPPLFFLGARYAFLFFGVRWSSFVLWIAIFCVASFFLLARQFRALGFSPIVATSLALTAELGTTVVCSYWWYNPATSMAVAMVFTSTLVCLSHPEKARNWFLLGTAFTLLLLSKPNGWPIGGCLVPLFFAKGARRRRPLIVIAFSLLFSALICWVHGLDPLGVLRSYSGVAATRGNPFRSIFHGRPHECNPVETFLLVAAAATLVGLFLRALAANRGNFRSDWREYSICCFSVFTALAMFNMNAELKTSDLMPLVLALAMLIFQPWSSCQSKSTGRTAIVVVITFFVTLSTYWAMTRTRVRTIGEGMFFEAVPTQTIQSGFFKGMHSGPRLIRVLKQIESALHKYPANKVFFGPRMEFSYAVFHREPPKGLPIWWDPGTSFALEDFFSISREFDNNNFDLLIFLKGDYTRFGLLYKITSYEKVNEFSELDVYVRRKKR